MKLLSYETLCLLVDIPKTSFVVLLYEHFVWRKSMRFHTEIKLFTVKLLTDTGLAFQKMQVAGYKLPTTQVQPRAKSPPAAPEIGPCCKVKPEWAEAAQ